MSGSNSSAPGSSVAPEPLSFTVHSMPSPALGDTARRTAAGRLKMLAVLAVCAAPVVASYLTYFVFRPESHHRGDVDHRAGSERPRVVQRVDCRVDLAVACVLKAGNGEVRAEKSFFLEGLLFEADPNDMEARLDCRLDGVQRQ